MGGPKSRGKAKSSRHTPHHSSNWGNSREQGEYHQYESNAAGRNSEVCLYETTTNQKLYSGNQNPGFQDPSPDPTVPRGGASELYPVAESSQQDEEYTTNSSSHYTLDKQEDSVEAVSQALGMATIEDTGPVNISTADKRTKSEAFDPRKM